MTIPALTLLLLSLLASSLTATPILLRLPSLSLLPSNTTLLPPSLRAVTDLTLRAKCITQRPEPQRQFLTAQFLSCAKAIAKINRPAGLNSGTPATFSYRASADFVLPRTYSDGDCAVVIDIDSDRAVDRFPFELMKDAAWTIASNCVAGEKSARLGGKGLVGPKEIVSVTVFGIRVRAGD